MVNYNKPFSPDITSAMLVNQDNTATLDTDHPDIVLYKTIILAKFDLGLTTLSDYYGALK